MRREQASAEREPAAEILSAAKEPLDPTRIEFPLPLRGIGISPAGSDARNPAQLHPLKRVQSDKGDCFVAGKK